MKFSRATEAEIDAVTKIVDQCRDELMGRGILQWDAQYPNREFFRKATADNTLFILTSADVVYGGVVLDECQAQEWENVEWQETGGKSLVVHSLAVLPSAHGRGLGAAMLGYCEAFAHDAGYLSLRLDAFSGNAAALRFYVRHGYLFQGEIDLTFKPVGHQKYFCYEKLLVQPAA